MIRALKRLQLGVAAATTLALGTGLLWPGVMGLFLVPLALIYVVWAARAALGHRLSTWLAFLTTLMVAVFLGAFAITMAASEFRTHDPARHVPPPVLMDPYGNVIEAPPETLPQFSRAQARIDRRDRIHVSILLLIGMGAWLVVGMHALAWRRVFADRLPSPSEGSSSPL